jgi:hypothetical protein
MICIYIHIYKYMLGLVGRVLGFDALSRRYMIALENGYGNKRIKRCNLLTEGDLNDAGGVEEDVSCTSGSECHDALNYSRISARGPGESLSAAPACL